MYYATSNINCMKYSESIMESAASSEIVFFVNGRKVVESNPQPDISLLYYLRNHLDLKGTKLGCNAGGCGACTVMVSRFDHDKKEIQHIPVNACLAPLCSVDGMAVTTVEGIGSTKTGVHPVQERIANSHGSQCGFCTPGIVMSMYTLLRNRPKPNQEELDTAFEGNLCRCTGYRPIIEGFRTFTEGCCGGSNSVTGTGCCKQTGKAKAIDRNEQRKTSGDVRSDLIKPNDFTPYDPTQELIFPPELMLAPYAVPRKLHIKGDHVTWIRPCSLVELLELKNLHPYAQLVVGNTEMGIETRFQNQHFPLVIAATHIPELKAVVEGEEGVAVGASVTVNKLGEVAKEVKSRLPEHKTRIFTGIIEMLKWFAGKQIRSVGAIAGNIMAHKLIADLNTVFMGAGCFLTVESATGPSRKIKMDQNFHLAHRKTALKPNEVIVSVHIPFTSENEYYHCYKQTRRRKDDKAIVNAGLRVELEQDNHHTNKWRVKECTLCYGGMAPISLLALKTMTGLKGRTWDDSLMPLTCRLLGDDFPLSNDNLEEPVEYKRSLVTSLFFRFYLNVVKRLNENQSIEAAKIPGTFSSAAHVIPRQALKSSQTFQDVPGSQSPKDVLGRPTRHMSATKQATGEAVYCDDMPRYHGELHLARVLSTRAHARIISVDPTEALTCPGVRVYLDANDVPGSNASGMIALDEEIFATEEVTCVGQVIGAILADTKLQAQRAVKAVKVIYEDLPTILTIEEAIAADSFFELSHPLVMFNGDLEAGFATSDHIIEGEMRVGGQEHFYLETQVTIAVPKGEDGEMELFASTQNPTRTQEMVAEALGVPFNNIVVRTKRMGGGFGGKGERSQPLSCAVAVAAWKTGKPVRCMLERDEDMRTTGNRHPFLSRYKVGFKSDGRIQALDVHLYSNAGNSLDISGVVMEAALINMDNCYRVPNIRGTGHICKTNLPSNTAFRGVGSPQTITMAENWISDVAITCGISQDQVREINLFREGDLTHFGQPMVNCNLQRVWRDVLERSNYEQRKQNVETYNRENRWKKRGIALTPTKYGISFECLFLNQAGALIHVYTDGSVLLTHGGTEMGQGLHTKMAQVASRVLEIPLSKILISETSTNTVPNTSPTSASVSTDLNGMAVKAACEKIQMRLTPFKNANPEGQWKDWVQAAYQDRVSLSATGFYKTPGLTEFDWKASKGTPFSYFSYGAACSEVEIDCLTGDHQILRTDLVMDVGRSINPAIDIGQIEGAFVQGIGLYTLEEIKFSRDGSLLTFGPATYKIPGFQDIPMEFNVHILPNSSNDKAVFSSKGVGEPPLFLASSVLFAIKEAIRAARRDVGLEGRFRMDSPATSERIRLACADQFTKQANNANKASRRSSL